MTAVGHALLLTGREWRAASRVPVFMVMNLVQPMIWLLLFGGLFSRVVDIPGFETPGGGTYLEFITPGVVMQTAMFGAAWAGTSFVQAMDRGVMDRMLASPVSRGAMIAASLVWYSVLACAQGLVVLGVAWLCGARFDGGPGGILVLLAAVVLLTCLFAALSNAVALITRQQDALIGVSQLLTIPLMFLSSALMDARLSAGWVAGVARFNPFDWAVVAGREALADGDDWGLVAGRLGVLAVTALAVAALSSTAFRAYRRAG